MNENEGANGAHPPNMNILLVTHDLFRLPLQLVLPERLSGTQTLPPSSLGLSFRFSRIGFGDDDDILLTRDALSLVLFVLSQQPPRMQTHLLQPQPRRVHVPHLSPPHLALLRTRDRRLESPEETHVRRDALGLGNLRVQKLLRDFNDLQIS